MKMYSSVEMQVVRQYKDQYLSTSHYLDIDQAIMAVYRLYSIQSSQIGLYGFEPSKCIDTTSHAIYYIIIYGDILTGCSHNELKNRLNYRGIILPDHYMHRMDCTFYAINT